MAIAKITFPHLGPYTPVFGQLLTRLGHDVVLPRPPTQKTLSLGTVYGPEFACLPLKICLGTYIESLEEGAELIVTTGGVGPCRAGLYATVQREILRNMGYEFDMIVLEPLRRHPVRLLRGVHRLNARRLPPWKLAQEALLCWKMIQGIDELHRTLLRIRPREVRSGSADRVFERSLQDIAAATSREAVTEAVRKGLQEMKDVPLDPTRDPVRIGIVGEIYVLLEPTANLNIEKILGELGVEVHRSIFLTNWTEENVVREGDNETAREAAAPYLDEMIGGHGQDSVGHTVLYARQGLDGVIQMAPFTCIPEIVACSILPAVSKAEDIPVISFFFDEQTGEAGMRTRLEAFVDLLVRRRERQRRQEAVGVMG